MDVAWLVVALAGAGLVAGLLAGLFGIGGGAILVPVFYQVFGLIGIDEAIRMHLSVGTSLAIIVPTSIRSFLSHKAKGAVDMELLRTYIIAVPTGVLLATLVFASISSEGLRIVFAAIAVLVGIRLVVNRSNWQLGDELPKGIKRFGVGALIGFLSTLMGIGGGVLNNTFMTLFNRPIHQAVATSSGVGVLISVPGFVGSIWAGWGAEGLPFLSTGYVNWLAVALIIPVTLLVAPVGVKIAHKLEKRQLEIGFGIFMFIVAGRFILSVLQG
ncbi:sulfite exporter TauE/SafE family protein [Oricola thermophila]|uniref:Probable membrane transporter protein n=1 Tax=Oricola thermophila TaxID=2742145 RepID=A0A6N1VHZ2_9HYPH|nr:sulfite exporter TauE/SafE family protein [Oricola thermophila]QKV20510.1 sulfite exporter TauE/SafE family protein [Oricola thermophila]